MSLSAAVRRPTSCARSGRRPRAQALGRADQLENALFLVAPDAWHEDFFQQLARPAFSRVSAGHSLRSHGELERQREAIARFGTGVKPLREIARALP